MPGLATKKVAILVDDYFEEAEFSGPLKALRNAGAKVDIVAIKKGEIHGLNHVDPANTYQADWSIDEVSAEDYDALVLPGGAINADQLRMNDRAKSWVKKFINTDRPVAAICHAPWLLASAGMAKGRKLTSYFTIQDDMRNADAEWVDQEVVVDGNLITSRKPDDVPAFNKALISALQGA